MNRTLQLQQDRTALQDGIRATLAKAAAEKRILSAEEITAIETSEASAQAITNTLNIEQRMAAASNMHTDHRPAEVHNNAENRDFGPAKRAGETPREAAYRRQAAFGEFMQCVKQAAITPSAIDPRLQKRGALGANEKVGSEGGFLVGTDVSNQLLEDIHDVGVLAPLCTEIPISSSANATTLKGVDETSRVDGSRFGGVQAYWSDEAGATTATKPKFREIEMKLRKLFALFYATDETVQDAAQLGALAMRAFAEEMAFKVDAAILEGTGGGQPQGVLLSGSLISVAKQTGQAANTILYENIVEMEARMTARSLARAAWFINVNCMPQLRLMTIPGGTASTPVFLPPNGAAGAPFGTLLGKAIQPIEHCSSVGTKGDIILADWSQYLLATKGGLQQAESMHVQFLTGEMTYRFVYRVDGQTLRAKALTPYKGTGTLGAFVVLDTRA